MYDILVCTAFSETDLAACILQIPTASCIMTFNYDLTVAFYQPSIRHVRHCITPDT